MKFYIEFEPCKECKELVREISDSMEVEGGSKKFLRHITYNHSEIAQAILKDFPKEAKKEDFPWFK